MEFTIRLIKPSDYPSLTLFWALAGEPVNAMDIYPAHSTYIVEKDGEMLYAVGVYKVEGVPVAFAEGLMRNPNKASDNEALKGLQRHIECVARERGCKTLIAISKNAGLEKHHAKLGYNKVSDGAFMVKGL